MQKGKAKSQIIPRQTISSSPTTAWSGCVAEHKCRNVGSDHVATVMAYACSNAFTTHCVCHCGCEVAVSGLVLYEGVPVMGEDMGGLQIHSI